MGGDFTIKYCFFHNKELKEKANEQKMPKIIFKNHYFVYLNEKQKYREKSNNQINKINLLPRKYYKNCIN